MYVLGDDDVSGLVMELFVDNSEAAKADLISHGCEVIRWRGKGQDCYTLDPFVVTFNIWELSEADQGES